jgi:hypothetical protein
MMQASPKLMGHIDFSRDQFRSSSDRISRTLASPDLSVVKEVINNFGYSS